MKINPKVPKAYYRTSVKAVITNDSRDVLIVNERNGGWDLPGGGLDWGEDTLSALAREMIEELGCEAKIDPQPKALIPWNNNSTNVHVLWVLYLVTVNKSDIKPTEDVKEAKFVSIDEYIAILANQEKSSWQAAVDFRQTLHTLIS